jgi:hypothetical protein
MMIKYLDLIWPVWKQIKSGNVHYFETNCGKKAGLPKAMFFFGCKKGKAKVAG